MIDLLIHRDDIRDADVTGFVLEAVAFPTSVTLVVVSGKTSLVLEPVTIVVRVLTGVVAGLRIGEHDVVSTSRLSPHSAGDVEVETVGRIAVDRITIFVDLLADDTAIVV